MVTVTESQTQTAIGARVASCGDLLNELLRSVGEIDVCKCIRTSGLGSVQLELDPKSGSCTIAGTGSFCDTIRPA